MRAKNRQAKQNGQILIIMLLIMAVVLTLGLTASRQVTTDLKVSRQQAESAKAYSAAESGLEKALAGLGTDKTDLEAGYVSATVEQQDIGGTSPELVWPSTVRQGEGMFFWLTGHHADGAIDYDNYYNGSLTFCWQKADNNGDTIPAVVAALFYDQGKKVKYWALDADRDSRTNDNNFDAPVSPPAANECPNNSFNYSKTISLSVNDPVFLWIRVFYADAQLGFKGNANLPIQGYVYTSTGEVAPTDAPEVISRRIQAFKTFKQPDPILLEPLVSFGDIKAVMP